MDQELEMAAAAGDAAGGAPKTPTRKAGLKTQGAGVHVADVKARAGNMLKKGLISQKAHDGLMAKASKVSAALQSPDTALE